MYRTGCRIIFLYVFRCKTCSSGIYYCRIGKSFQIIDFIRSGKSGYRYQFIQSYCVSQASVWTCGRCYGKLQGSFLDNYFGCCFSPDLITYLSLIFSAKSVHNEKSVGAKSKLCSSSFSLTLIFPVLYPLKIRFVKYVFTSFFAAFCQIIIAYQSSLYINKICCIVDFFIVITLSYRIPLLKQYLPVLIHMDSLLHIILFQICNLVSLQSP